MRKLIIILLIAVIACTEVDTTPKEEVSDFNGLLDLLDLDINSVELNWITEIGKKIGRFFGKAWDSVKSTIQKLKDNGTWDKLVAYAKAGARVAASTLCSKYLTPAVCVPLINAVFSLF